MKNRNNIRAVCFLISCILVTVIFNSCKTAPPAVDYKDLSYLYNPTKSPINPQFNIINNTDESSVLSVRFSAGDLFFSEANPQNVATAEVMITVKLYNLSQGKALSDTAQSILSIVKVKGNLSMFLMFP